MDTSVVPRLRNRGLSKPIFLLCMNSFCQWPSKGGLGMTETKCWGCLTLFINNKPSGHWQLACPWKPVSAYSSLTQQHRAQAHFHRPIPRKRVHWNFAILGLQSHTLGLVRPETLPFQHLEPWFSSLRVTWRASWISFQDPIPRVSDSIGAQEFTCLTSSQMVLMPLVLAPCCESQQLRLEYGLDGELLQRKKVLS